MGVGVELGVGVWCGDVVVGGGGSGVGAMEFGGGGLKFWETVLFSG